MNDIKLSTQEKIIEDFLKEHNINYIPQYTFDDCRYKNKLPFDFALFDDNNKLTGIIEYDGIRHFKHIQNSDSVLEKIVVKDEIKTQYCQDNYIPLLRIPYLIESKANIERLLRYHLLQNNAFINYSEECPSDIDVEDDDEEITHDPFLEYHIDYITELYLNGKLDDFLDNYYSKHENNEDNHLEEQEEIVEEPSYKRFYTEKDTIKKDIKLYKINDEEKSIPQWCDYYDIKPATVYQRISHGWEINENLFNKNYARVKPTERNVKLNEEQVRDIRRIYKNKEMTVIEIQKKFNISQGAIYNIVNYRSWKWVD